MGKNTGVGETFKEYKVSYPESQETRVLALLCPSLLHSVSVVSWTNSFVSPLIQSTWIYCWKGTRGGLVLAWERRVYSSCRLSKPLAWHVGSARGHASQAGLIRRLGDSRVGMLQEEVVRSSRKGIVWESEGKTWYGSSSPLLGLSISNIFPGF